MFIQWLGHASFKFYIGNKIIYIDPYSGDNEDYFEKADIVLVSHGHYDHCSREKIALVRVDDTIVLSSVKNSASINAKSCVPGNLERFDDITIELVPAYNVRKSFHTKEDGNLGFVICAENKRIYFAGDTDLIPEMDVIKADIAIVPVGGTYTMNAEQAARCVGIVGAKLAIPMHFGGGIVGNIDDAEYFKDLCERDPEVRVKIMGPGDRTSL